MMKNESGRSMVEMLGVLAIIGVLSVGGIAGYTMAMNKYKANEVAAAASQCGMLAMAKFQISPDFFSEEKSCADLAVEYPSAMNEDDDMTVTVEDNLATVTVKTDASYANALSALAGTSNGFSLVVEGGDAS